MAEVLFVLVTIYIVYIVQGVFSGDYKKKDTSIKANNLKPVEIKVTETKESSISHKVTTAQVEKKVTPVKKTVAKKTVSKKTPAVKSKAKKAASELRNPKTGEVAKIANSYRMTKRWIKEALVEEGLLSKVYKTNELDDAAKTKIDKALIKLAKMDKYQ